MADSERADQARVLGSDRTDVGARRESKQKAVTRRTWLRHEPKVQHPPMGFGRWVRILGWRHVFAVLVVLFALYPVIWILSSSVNPVQTLSGAQLIPDNPTVESYRTILENPTLNPFMTWLWNSWKIALFVGVFNVVLAAMAAYAFSRFRFRGRRMGLLALLLVQIFPQLTLFIALFLILQRIGTVFPAIGLNTHAGLILVYLGAAVGFNTFLIKGFMDAVPLSLDESARVDGAGPVRIFWQIIMPLMRPVLAVIFIITVVNIFSEYVLARTLLRSTEQLTYAIGLQTYTLSDYGSKWGVMSAGAVIGALPVVVTFLIAQRAIVSGLTQGAVKG